MPLEGGRNDHLQNNGDEMKRTAGTQDGPLIKNYFSDVTVQ